VGLEVRGGPSPRMWGYLVTPNGVILHRFDVRLHHPIGKTVVACPIATASVGPRKKVTPANPSGLRLPNSPGPQGSLHLGIECQRVNCRQARICSRCLEPQDFLNFG